MVVAQDNAQAPSKNKKAEDKVVNSQIADLVEQLQAQLDQAVERERRAQADYQNLMRRTQEERTRLIALANSDLLEELLQPLDHLELAAGQLKDKGLDMILGQFKSTLSQFGLEKIDALGKKFDIATMEVIEKENETGDKVIKVVANGYTLNGQVIRHAKVVIG